MGISIGAKVPDMWSAFAVKKHPHVEFMDLVLLFVQGMDGGTYVGTTNGGMQRIPHGRDEIVGSGEVIPLNHDIEVYPEERALVVPNMGRHVPSTFGDSVSPRITATFDNFVIFVDRRDRLRLIMESLRSMGF